MNAQKAAEQAQARSSVSPEGRKPWKKKTPVEVVLNQIDRLREGVVQKEEELKQTKRQLQKLEEVKKILEAT
jgi:hypothetical protein